MGYDINVTSREGNLRSKKWIIINLDDSTGEGTHWVVLRNGDGKTEVNEYFDSFGLDCPKEVEDLGPYLYNNAQYQHIDSLKCGYYCLYFINERSKRDREKGGQIRKYYNSIKKLSVSDEMKNERLIKNYFTNSKY